MNRTAVLELLHYVQLFSHSNVRRSINLGLTFFTGSQPLALALSVPAPLAITLFAFPLLLLQLLLVLLLNCLPAAI